MKHSNFVFSSESVTEGHPDKVADLISDGVLDAILAKDPKARVACETLVATDLVVLAGEITTTAKIDHEKIARETIRSIGYNDPDMGFQANTCQVQVFLHSQSPDISQGVTEGEGLHKEQGAGDQGLMFGYATAETKALMPTPIWLAHQLTQKLTEVRKSGKVKFFRPDGKAQVSVRYEDNKPVHLDAVVVSTQHTPDVSHAKIEEAVMEEVIKKVCPPTMLSSKTRYLVNPTGRFVIGGPHGDSGLTGRKIIVDTYGGWGRHGGGAFSGKDPSKVDRSACYMARYIAKNIVAAGLAHHCEVQIAYAIGFAEPVSFMVDTFGTGTASDEEITKLARSIWDLKPAAIIRQLDLLRPIYQKTTNYGHFGRNEPEFIWEKTDKVVQLRESSKTPPLSVRGGREGLAQCV